MSTLRGLCIGAGYFAQYHLDAWQRLPDVDLAAVCDLDEAKARAAGQQFGIQYATDVEEALDRFEVDFVDMVTPPQTHLALIEQMAARGLPTICQKPLAPDFASCCRIAEIVRESGLRFMVHENFRFQPWHREIKRLLAEGAIGGKLHGITFRARPGDGRGPDAYLNRQPYFRSMPRLLIHETGVHFIDTFRYLAGEIDEVYAILRRLNPVIAGEDAGLVTFRFRNAAVGVWDANRCNESLDKDPRYTFGEMLVEGEDGSIRLYGDGRITVQPFGDGEREHEYEHSRRGFAGDCVYLAQRHFLERLRDGGEFETGIDGYLRTLTVQEAVYRSAEENRPVQSDELAVRSIANAKPGRRIVDLSLPIDENMPRATVTRSMTIAANGWNASTLELYSHCGTHMDAPYHFLSEAATIEKQPLAACCGPARILDLTPVSPRELIDVERLAPWAHQIRPGARLLLRSDWHRRFGTEEYRRALPRISARLARWLVERQVALVGVEPPSVADVNDLDEVTEVHQILLGGGVVIVEGLARLCELSSDVVEFIAFPLPIAGGDGSPVRAVAIESDL